MRLLALLPTLLLAAPALAQGAPADPRALQVWDLERERRLTLAMVDSMPERLLRYRPTPGVRDFAEQIAHASGPIAGFSARAAGIQPPAPGDSAVFLNSRAALRAYVAASYDFALTTLRALPEEKYRGSATIAGQVFPVWKIFALAHEHSVWTRGELVSYFRLNGMAPPAYDLFGMGGGER